MDDTQGCTQVQSSTMGGKGEGGTLLLKIFGQAIFHPPPFQTQNTVNTRTKEPRI